MASFVDQFGTFVRQTVRELVSQNRARYVDDRFNLDLSYILPNVIAMGYPAGGLEGFYRNSLDEVALFLNEKHGGNMLVFNLSERPYNYSKLQADVLELGWPDHHAPPLDHLFSMCQKAAGWLQSDPAHVVVVHCLAGRGRTGVLIASLMLFLDLAQTDGEALGVFAARRDRDGNTLGGVTRPCQLQYVAYFARTLNLVGPCADIPLKPPAPTLLLRRILVHSPRSTTVQGSCRPFLTVAKAPVQKQVDEVFYSSAVDMSRRVGEAFPTYWPGKETGLMIAYEPSVAVAGDIIVRFHDIAQGWMGLGLGSDEPRQDLLWRFQLNTRFVELGGPMIFRKADIDDAHDDRFLDGEAFRVELYFEVPPSGDVSSTSQ